MEKFKPGDTVTPLKWKDEKGEIISSYRTYIETRYKIKLHSDPSSIFDASEDDLVLVKKETIPKFKIGDKVTNDSGCFIVKDLYTNLKKETVYSVNSVNSVNNEYYLEEQLLFHERELRLVNKVNKT